jgi:sarcosine oxidase delta subunit
VGHAPTALPGTVRARWEHPKGGLRHLPVFKVTVADTSLGVQRALWALNVPVALQRAAHANRELKRMAHAVRTYSADWNDRACITVLEQDISELLTVALQTEQTYDWSVPAADAMPALPLLPSMSLRLSPESQTPAGWLLRVPLIGPRFSEEQQVLLDRIQDFGEWERQRLEEWRERERSLQARERALHAQCHAEAYRRYASGHAGQIEELLQIAMTCSPYPVSFPVEHLVSYDGATRVAKIEVRVPDETSLMRPPCDCHAHGERPQRRSAEDARAVLERAVRLVLLRTAHEAFCMDHLGHIGGCIVSTHVERIDPATGTTARKCIGAVRISRLDFEALNLRSADPDACLLRLNARFGPRAGSTPQKPSESDQAPLSSVRVVPSAVRTSHVQPHNQNDRAGPVRNFRILR